MVKGRYALVKLFRVIMMIAVMLSLQEAICTRKLFTAVKSL
jgi:hypothetical protein